MPLQELDRQALGIGVVLEVARLHGCSCFGGGRTELFSVAVPALEEVLHLESKRGDYILGFAPSKAPNEYSSILALCYGEARLVVVVSRA